jgi:hypothetical protein
VSHDENAIELSALDFKRTAGWHKIMPRTWIVPLAGLFVLSGLSAACGEWVEAVSVDRLTGQKTIVMTNPALNSARQFGRKVSAKLTLQCIENRERVRLPRAAIIFSERVASETVRTKYRIDNDLVQRNKLAAVENDGTTLVLGWAEFMSRLPSSSILRIEFSLPSAGDALIEFDTTGAKEAFSRIQCAKPRMQN